MIQRLRIVLVLVAVAIIAASVWALLAYRAESQKRARETNGALRKTAEFLQPDIASDLRFGKPKTTPAPAAP